MFHGKQARRLDALLSGASSPTPADRPLFPLLHTAERLRELEEQAEPSVFLTRTLEQRLMREAAEIRKAGPNAPKQHVATTSAWDSPPQQREWDVDRRRRLFWRLAAVAVILFSLAGTLSLASQATPASPLYGLRQLERTVQLQLAFDSVARAQVRVAVAQDALAELEYAITQRKTNPANYRAHLAEFQRDYQAASDAVAAVSSSNQRAGLEPSLDEIRARAIADLHGALVGMDWPDRVATTTTLGALGETTPTITRVTYTRVANGLTLQISGAGFVSGATLYLDGRSAGAVNSVAASAIQATLPAGTALDSGATVGVSNPDGTAAQFTLAGGE
jgi:hypothetical protein